jgi:PAS domain S-box-containing protein
MCLGIAVVVLIVVLNWVSSRILWELLISIAVIGLVTGLLALMILERHTLKRIKQVMARVQDIGYDGRSPVRVELSGSDELSRLAEAINGMLSQLQAAHTKLLEQQRQTTTLMSNLPGMAYRCRNDQEWRMEFVSDGCRKLTGYASEDLTENKKRSYADLIHTDDRQTVWDSVQAMVEKKQPFQLTYRILAANGDLKWVFEQGCGVFDSEGKLVALEGFISDITQRHQAEAALRKSEEHFRSLTASSPVGIMLTSPDGQCVYANPRCRSLFGMTLMSCLGDGWTSSVHPDERANVLHDWLTFAKERRELNREFRVQIAPDSVRWIKMRSSPMSSEVSDLRGHVLVVDDITERKLAEDQLRLQGQALESAANGIVITDHDGNIVWVNRAFTELSGYSRDEIIGRKPSILKSGKQDATCYRELWDTVLAGRIWRGEMINKRKDGTLYIEEMTITPVSTESGVITHFIAIKQDVSKRKQAETALRRSEKRYRDLVDTARDVIFTLSTSGECLSLNPAFEVIIGKSADEWIGKPFAGLVHPADLQTAFEYFWQVLQGRQPAPFELRFEQQNGKIIIGEITVTPQFEDGQIVAIFGVARDITERKQLQNELHHRQQMEAVGRLAGGIAHDFNNILTAITGYSELTLHKMDAANPLRRHLHEIYQASHRAAALTRQLLAFSRKQVLQPRVVDLNTVVAGIQKMLTRLITENIELQTLLRANPGWVKADPGQLEQVIINLVVNARDAMPAGGRLTIETATAEQSVILVVTDTGHGMTEEIKQHIFEPFFTTKAQGQGTGLGLATSFGIIQQSGGRITVDSAPGRGSTFRVHLPLLSGPEAVSEETKTAEMPTGTETILVTEDEGSVREFTAGMLRELGYTVLVAGDGQEGRRIAETLGSRRIDLLFTDVVMPQMGGRELADWFQVSRPETKVLFTTGYTTDQQVWASIREGRSSLLEKPFTPAALANKVREILDKRC